MDDQIISLLNYIIPAKWHITAGAIVAAILLGGRIYHAVISKGGLVGVWNALVFGTNVPKPSTQKDTQNETHT